MHLNIDIIQHMKNKDITSATMLLHIYTSYLIFGIVYGFHTHFNEHFQMNLFVYFSATFHRFFGLNLQQNNAMLNFS